MELGRASAPTLPAGDAYRAFAHGSEGLSLVPIACSAFIAGTLGALGLGDIFGHLLAGIRSGKLVVTRGTIRKTVSFRDGQIVFATSSERHERLGGALIRLGLVSREQLDQALLKVGPRARLGQVLTRTGLITSANLYSAMTYLVREIVVNLFEMAEGEVLFLEGDPDRDALKLPERTRGLVLEGMKRGEEVVRLRHKLPSTLRVAVAPGRLPPTAEGLAAQPVRESTLAELRPRFDGSEHAFLLWVDEQLRSGDWVQAPSGEEPAATSQEMAGASVLQRYEEFVLAASRALLDAGESLGALRAFLHAPPPGLEDAFADVTLSDEGRLDLWRIAANLGGEGAPLARARIYEALDSFVAYALFSVHNILPPELAETLAERFAQMREGR